MSANDYVKYITQQVVRYLDTPKEERSVKKARKKNEEPPLLNKWFGVLPFAFSLLLKKRNKK
ncbi:YqzE family protein [Bacillus lacus]|uniref:YqzE family protein n=1 Tax=Metabacillus lacus TaxID=1983721 RepID=A0A7X2IZL8_9BACI|nr:YqzE family protein [Metabacillus lacus]MRX72610.1 YqzE family protein [Metabacillus lacus]